MGKKIISVIILMMLIGCGQKVTEEVLMEGTWIATSGYEDGEETSDPNCYPFEDGIDFKNDDTVFVQTYDRDFEYMFFEEDSTIRFLDNTRSYIYEIIIIAENKIVLEGLSWSNQEGRSCVLERK